MITTEFKNALKLHPIPQFKLAWKAGITPNVLNHLINGHQRVMYGDKRLLKIADSIKFPRSKVFERK